MENKLSWSTVLPDVEELNRFGQMTSVSPLYSSKSGEFGPAPALKSLAKLVPVFAGDKIHAPAFPTDKGQNHDGTI